MTGDVPRVLYDPKNQHVKARGQAAAGAGHHPGERLARLRARRDRGLLAGAEYEAQRQRIISEI